MNRTRLWLAVVACLWLLPALPAAADVPVQAQVVNSCGSMAYPAGSIRTLTQTTNGLACTSPSGSSGSTSNASSGVATSATNAGSVAYNYGFNGATWDQLQVDGSKNLKVVLAGPLGRSADASSVSTALSTEDVGALTPAKTSGTPCATATTAGCSIPDIDALIAQTAGNPILVGPSASPTALIQATASVPITFTAAGGPTQIIGASGSTKIYITHWDVVLSGAGTFVLVTGTGTNCGTNTAYLNGASGHPLSFAANGGISAGSGLGAVLITGAGGEVCAITTGSVDSSGSIAYAQF